MPRILEKDMEELIETDLVATGFFKRDPSHYDKNLCLDTEILTDYLISTQKTEWDAYQKQHGSRAQEILAGKIKDEIDKRGTISLFRKPFSTYGVHFNFAYFKPASGMNENYRLRYQNNIFSVMRQVKYSNQNENSLDIVLFLNGIPLCTLELKDRLTGSGYDVNSAIKQYKEDRDPREPLFKYGRCLVHFALDEAMVYMTTHLNGQKTRFLPFNKGINGSIGNPETEGFSTEYLWKEILVKDSFLALIQRFIQESDVLDEDGKPTGGKFIVFPRYHQLDCVRKIIDHAQQNGVGNTYLIQHSAGSGKSNTISWLAHQLSNLHDASDHNIFDSIIIVTDRRILDSQLRKTVLSFELNPGVVAGIERGSKQLRQELEAGTKIIVSTLQKFPYIEEEIKSLPGKRFAIILDEAHSSSSGEMSKSLKKVLNLNSEDDDVEEERTHEDVIIETMKARAKQSNSSYFAFTATPKPKTLELFGNKQPDGTFVPFHVYSMKQAIQEQFIMDVLPNYVSYPTLFQLIKKIEQDPTYDQSKASRLLKTYVEMHEHTIEKKAAIMVTHFIDNCINELGGCAKAMVVCSSRAQAIKYKLAFDKYINEQKLHIKSLVAFSGSVEIFPEAGKPTEYTEQNLNGFPDTQTANIFKQREYKFLIVANKYQTGFDQPLLYAMYLNKKVQGVSAVQTISRLNRVFAGKKDPITLDFANNPKIIKQSFQDFYEDVLLEEESDPDKLYDFKRDLENFHYYTAEDIEKFVKIFYAPKLKQEKLSPVLNPVVKLFDSASDEDKKRFRSTLKSYIRVYSFISQIINFSDPTLEKLYGFGRILIRLLKVESKQLPKEVLQQVDLDSLKVEFVSKGITLIEGEGGKFKPGDETPGGGKEFLEPLSEIIKKINEKYAAQFTEEDKIVAGLILSRLKNDKDIAAEIKINPKENVMYSFEKRFNEQLQSMIEENFEFYKKINNDQTIKSEMIQNMFTSLYASMRGSV